MVILKPVPASPVTGNGSAIAEPFLRKLRRFGLCVDHRLCDAGQRLISLLFLRQSLLQQAARLRQAQLACPGDLRAIARYLVVLDCLGGGKKAGSEGGSALVFRHDLLAFIQNAHVRFTGLATGSFPDLLEYCLEPFDLAFSFLQMLLECRAQFVALGDFRHLRQRAHDLLLGEIDVFEGLVKQVAQRFGLCHVILHGSASTERPTRAGTISSMRRFIAMRGVLPNSSRTSEHSAGSSWFSRMANATASWTGRPVAFLPAFLVVLIWGISGPIFLYSDTWLLVINTGTTIVTFLMVFLIQNTQNRDTMAMQVKLSELIIALNEANNRIADIEDASDEELEEAHEEVKQRASTDTLNKHRKRKAGEGRALPSG